MINLPGKYDIVYLKLWLYSQCPVRPTPKYLFFSIGVFLVPVSLYKKNRRKKLLNSDNRIKKNQQEPFATAEVFKECFHEYYERLHRYAFTIIRDNEEAEDIVQMAFIKLWQKRDAVNIDQSGRFYLYKSVYHACLNTIRNKMVKQKYTSKFPIPIEGVISAITEEREIDGRVIQAIETLPPKCKEIFMKSRYEGKRYAEIAIELGISVKTVEAQMGKALKILRNLLADLIK